jgi:hypothetical protein
MKTTSDKRATGGLADRHHRSGDSRAGYQHDRREGSAMTDRPDLQKIAADILSGKIDVAQANEGLTAAESEKLAELLTAEAKRLEHARARAAKKNRVVAYTGRY